MTDFQKISRNRQQIDRLDRAIIMALAKRFNLVRRLDRLKRENHLPLVDLAREEELHDLHTFLAKKNGIDPELVNKLFRTILKASRNIQKTMKRSSPRKTR